MNDNEEWLSEYGKNIWTETWGDLTKDPTIDLAEDVKKLQEKLKDQPMDQNQRANANARAYLDAYLKLKHEVEIFVPAILHANKNECRPLAAKLGQRAQELEKNLQDTLIGPDGSQNFKDKFKEYAEGLPDVTAEFPTKEAMKVILESYELMRRDGDPHLFGCQSCGAEIYFMVDQGWKHSKATECQEAKPV